MSTEINPALTAALQLAVELVEDEHCGLRDYKRADEFLKKAKEALAYRETKGYFFVGTFAGEPAGFLGYEEHLAGPKGVHMNFCFICYVDTNQIVGDGSFSEYRWFEPDEVAKLENCPVNVKQCVQRIIDRLIIRGFKD